MTKTSTGPQPEHDHAHHGEADHHHTHTATPRRRWTMIGVGIAGGLVPSPSALVVLLGAVALGRTAFGILLVIGYGLGMATTLPSPGSSSYDSATGSVPAPREGPLPG
ncbi:hypothetical protein [Streptomyces sp. NPDC008122]|uniref:hypothetical protein n=1 Tax=Streptomyces sp. NPDC008122 TaxID=3364810 RepID=UPI0036E27A30